MTRQERLQPEAQRTEVGMGSLERRQLALSQQARGMEEHCKLPQWGLATLTVLLNFRC